MPFKTIPAAPPPRAIVWWLDGVFPFAAATLAIALFSLLLGSALSGSRRPSSLEASARLKEIHQALVIYANVHTGYPAHAALLLADDYVSVDLFEDPMLGDSTVTVGGMDLLDYDWSERAHRRLEAEIARGRAASYYRIGGFWLARLPAPTGSTKLIAGWSTVYRNDTRLILFDDNHVEHVDARGWTARWVCDEQERRARGIRPVRSPPWTAKGRQAN